MLYYIFIYLFFFFLTILNLLAKSILCLLGARGVSSTLLTAKALVKYFLYKKKMISQGMQRVLTNSKEKILNLILAQWQKRSVKENIRVSQKMEQDSRMGMHIGWMQAFCT